MESTLRALRFGAILSALFSLQIGCCTIDLNCSSRNCSSGCGPRFERDPLFDGTLKHRSRAAFILAQIRSLAPEVAAMSTGMNPSTTQPCATHAVTWVFPRLAEDHAAPGSCDWLNSGEPLTTLAARMVLATADRAPLAPASATAH